MFVNWDNLDSCLSKNLLALDLHLVHDSKNIFFDYTKYIINY